MKKNVFATGIVGAFAATLLMPLAAFASTPYLDEGITFSPSEPYSAAQSLGDISDGAAIYGKLLGATPIDGYSFTVSEDSEHTLALLVKESEVSDEATPTAIIVDPTGLVINQQLGLPLPEVEGKNYTTGVIQQIERSEWREYNEPFLGEKYAVTAEQRLSLKAGETYYLFVFDPSRGTERYFLHFGDANAWSFKDVVTHFGAWAKVKLDIYGETNPFTFDRNWVGGFMLMLGFATLFGYWLLQHTFALGAGKSKTFAYLLVKFQAVGRIILIAGLWLFIAGWITLTAGIGSTGAAFAALLAFIPFLIVALVEAIAIAPKLMALDVAKRETEIPMALRKRLFVTFAIGTVSLLALATFLGFAFSIR